MTKDTSWPAFPTVDANRPQYYGTTGMTIRQYAAIKAMQGLLAAVGGNAAQHVAEQAVKAADALLAELEK